MQIRLSNFSGPIELLLHLIRASELDPFDLDLHLITEQYLEVLEHEDLTTLTDAYHFLLMASALVEIKSRLLLPKEEEIAVEGEPTGEEMQEDLAQRLATYQRLKEAVADLGERLKASRRKLAPRLTEGLDKALVYSLKDLSLYDLISAFEDALTRVRETSQLSYAEEEIPLSKAMDEVWQRIAASREGVALSELLALYAGLSWLIVCFLAVLEHVNAGRVTFTRRGRDFVFTCCASNPLAEEG